MHRIISAVLGLIGFTAVVILGMVQNMGLVATLGRAAIAFAVGAVLGWIFFGPAGVLIMNEAAGGKVEPVPPAKEEEKTKEAEREVEKAAPQPPESGTS